MSERQGIEIDYCPQCRGVWLDRGELDKILERAKAESEVAGAPEAPRAPAAPQQQQYGQQQQARYDEPRYDDRRDSRDDHRGRDPRDDRRGYDSRQGNYRKKKSPFEFLGDIFEG